MNASLSEGMPVHWENIMVARCLSRVHTGFSRLNSRLLTKRTSEPPPAALCREWRRGARQVQFWYSQGATVGTKMRVYTLYTTERKDHSFVYIYLYILLKESFCTRSSINKKFSTEIRFLKFIKTYPYIVGKSQVLYFQTSKMSSWGSTLATNI